MKVNVDAIYPAVQFHISIDRDKPLNKIEKVYVRDAIKIDGAGLIHCEFTPRRIIITSSVPMTQSIGLGETYKEAIKNALIGE